jgi:hypothetical protein
MMLGIPDMRSKITLSQTIEESRIGAISSISVNPFVSYSHGELTNIFSHPASLKLRRAGRDIIATESTEDTEN